MRINAQVALYVPWLFEDGIERREEAFYGFDLQPKTPIPYAASIPSAKPLFHPVMED